MSTWLRHKTMICPLGQPRMLGRVISSWSAQPLSPLIQSLDCSGICQQLYSLRFRHEPVLPWWPPHSAPCLQTRGHPIRQASLSPKAAVGMTAAPVTTSTTEQQPPHVCGHTQNLSKSWAPHKTMTLYREKTGKLP